MGLSTMPTVDLTLSTPIQSTFRVEQVKGMFDLQVADKLSHQWRLDLPIEAEPYHVGVIVGPSGSGKSSIARHLFGDRVHKGFNWPADKAVVDAFPQGPIQEIVQALTAVGFSSPPSWLKPFGVLSMGERFRVELARLMLEADGLFVVDEFTSVVDRTVAKCGSAAVAKAIRKRNGQMVALSCHYDIIEWLEPDWVLDLKDNTFLRRRLRRPEIELELAQVDRRTWGMFAPHHYLSGKLHPGSQCFGCFWGPEIVAFAAVLPTCGFKGRRRVHRIVVLPDYQGVGIGKALLNLLGEHYTGQGLRLSITSSHPGIVRGLQRESRWVLRSFLGTGTQRHTGGEGVGVKSKRLAPVATYEFAR